MKSGMGFSTGKIIITGEHSVVYGYPAVVSAIEKGITVKVSDQQQENTQLTSGYQQHILKYFSKVFTVDASNLSVATESELLSSSGQGSSAAFALGLFRALADYFSFTISDDELFRLVTKAEAFVHTNPSGIDSCAVVYGHTHVFQKLDAHNTFEKKHLLIEKPYEFLVIHSGKAAESTGEMVQFVAQKHRKHNLSELFSKMGSVSSRIAEALSTSTFSGDLLDENEAYLEELGVVSQRAKNIIRIIRKNGGSAKVTGAGGSATGSGWILAYAPDITSLTKEAQTSGWENFTSTVQ